MRSEIGRRPPPPLPARGAYRPEGREFRCQNPDLVKVIEKALEVPDAWPLIVSRIDKDKEFIRSRFGDRVNFLEQAVDGLQLIWNSDVFISGGGTMNREAGLLGVPVYSIFTGRKPYLDEYLTEQPGETMRAGCTGQGRRLIFVDTLEKVSQIKIEKRDKPVAFEPQNPGLVKEVVDILVGLAG